MYICIFLYFLFYMSTEVIFSTSYDDKYPPSNILNENNNGMFWSSTGLYPQEIVLSLGQSKNISKIYIKGFNIKRMSIEACENDSAVKFSCICDNMKIPESKGIQEFTCECSGNFNSKIIKLIIHEGYGYFCIINSVVIK